MPSCQGHRRGYSLTGHPLISLVSLCQLPGGDDFPPSHHGKSPPVFLQIVDERAIDDDQRRALDCGRVAGPMIHPSIVDRNRNLQPYDSQRKYATGRKCNFNHELPVKTSNLVEKKLQAFLVNRFQGKN